MPMLRASLRGILADLEKTPPPRPPREVIGEMIRLIDDTLANAKPSSHTAQLEELRADLWDAQMEEDANSGALERAFGEAAEEAAEQDARGESVPLPR